LEDITGGLRDADFTSISVNGNSITYQQDNSEQFTATDGQVNYTLTDEPVFIYSVTINGISLSSSNYSTVTTTLTLTADIYANDKIEIKYKY
jgi:hypothetical protein